MVAKLVIGLLGGVGSGKSSVAAEFAKYGARVINADRFGHEALRQPAIRDLLVDGGGREILDENGKIVRSRVPLIVFADDKERRTLETLVHPYITRCIQEEIDAAKADPAVKFVVLDAAIMLETGWDKV